MTRWQDRRSAARIAGFLLPLMTAACASDAAGGPELAELETVAVDLAGHRTNQHCTQVPVLLGGRVRDEIDVAGEFSLVVDATADMVSVTFVGVSNAADLALTIESSALTAAFSERLEIETSAGRSFLVEFRARCAP